MSRKITSEIVHAFYHGHRLTKSNSQAKEYTMYLHGHEIAKIDKQAQKLFIRSAGWETNTTKERLNGLYGVSICQKKGLWYLNGYLWENSENWTDVDEFTRTKSEQKERTDTKLMYI